jgi:RNA polymerase sigma-70 factor (family 1)
LCRLFIPDFIYDVELHTDADLLELIIQDNNEAFTVIYNRHFHNLKQFVLKLLRSPELAEDVTQEVFMLIWTNRAKLNRVSSIKAYLFISARNRALDCLKAAFRSEVAMSEIIQSYVAERDLTDDDVLDKEYSIFLKRILATLPERSREIFTLCREQSKSYDEVAAILGVSRNAVKNHMVLAMKILRNAAEQELGVTLMLWLTLIFIS